MVTALVSLINKVFRTSVGAHHLILLTAVLLSLLVECIPQILGGNLFTRLNMSRQQGRTPPKLTVLRSEGVEHDSQPSPAARQREQSQA